MLERAQRLIGCMQISFAEHICGGTKMTKSTNERRIFLTRAMGVAATALTGVVLSSRTLAAEHGSDHDALGHGGSDGYVMSSSIEQHCASCEFWGGQRRVSEDGKEITVGGLGWCNNSESPNYQKLTSPEHGPMETWRKWSVLG